MSTTTTIPAACQACGQPREHLACARCGAQADVIDCGHYAQPAEIAGCDIDGKPCCQDCHDDGRCAGK